MRVTTSTSLHSVIARLSGIESLKIKRKTIVDRTGQVKRWWFIIHASESVLKSLDSRWEAVHLQTSWKLEVCYKPVCTTNSSLITDAPVTSENVCVDMPTTTLSPPNTIIENVAISNDNISDRDNGTSQSTSPFELRIRYLCC